MGMETLELGMDVEGVGYVGDAGVGDGEAVWDESLVL